MTHSLLKTSKVSTLPRFSHSHPPHSQLSCPERSLCVGRVPPLLLKSSCLSKHTKARGAGLCLLRHGSMTLGKLPITQLPL